MYARAHIHTSHTDLSCELVENVNQVAVLVLFGDENILKKGRNRLKQGLGDERWPEPIARIGFRARLWMQHTTVNCSAVMRWYRKQGC